MLKYALKKLDYINIIIILEELGVNYNIEKWENKIEIELFDHAIKNISIEGKKIYIL